MCHTVFSMIKGMNTFIQSNSTSCILCLFRYAPHLSWGAQFFHSNLSVDLQVHFSRQHGQHLSKHGPTDGGWAGGGTIQAGLPPGKRRRRTKLPRLTYLHLLLFLFPFAGARCSVLRSPPQRKIASLEWTVHTDIVKEIVHSCVWLGICSYTWVWSHK